MSDRADRARRERIVGTAPARQALPGDVATGWTPALFRLAYDRVAPGASVGTDGRRAVDLRPGELEALAEAVRTGRYRPASLRRATLGARTLGIATLADQIVMAAWRLLAEASLERRLASHVWGCRRGRDRWGAIRALGRASGARALVRCDVRRMFDSLDHGVLRGAVAGQWGDGPVWARTRWERALDWLGWGDRGLSDGRDPRTALVDQWLRGWTRGRGVPTGVSVAPALANVYMAAAVDPTVARMVADGSVLAGVRYMDDFALVVPDDGREALAQIEAAVRRAGLRLHPEKTRIHRVGASEDWPARVLGIDLAPRIRDGEVAIGMAKG